MRLTRALPLFLPVLIATAGIAGADLIFDIDARGVVAEVEYGVEGTAYEDVPLDPDVETVEFDWTSSANGGDLYAFTGTDGVNLFFGFLPPIDPDNFLLDFVFLSGVPTSHPSFPRIDVYTDNVSGNSFAEGHVLVDTPDLLVMEIEAGIHWNIPVYPEFSWGGAFVITAVRTPEPTAAGLLALALAGCLALGRKRNRSGRRAG